MIEKIEYKSLEERSTILLQNSGKILIEEQNIEEGNFLIFSDIPIQHAPTLEERIANVEGAIIALMGV